VGRGISVGMDLLLLGLTGILPTSPR